MNEYIDEIAKLEARFPELVFTVDQAETTTGSSWIDIAGGPIAIEYKPGVGFGVFLSADDGYGSRPDEVYTDAELLFKRLDQLKTLPLAHPATMAT